MTDSPLISAKPRKAERPRNRGGAAALASITSRSRIDLGIAALPAERTGHGGSGVAQDGGQLPFVPWDAPSHAGPGIHRSEFATGDFFDFAFPACAVVHQNNATWHHLAIERFLFDDDLSLAAIRSNQKSQSNQCHGVLHATSSKLSLSDRNCLALS
jgi:hypothetical protein